MSTQVREGQSPKTTKIVDHSCSILSSSVSSFSLEIISSWFFSSCFPPATSSFNLLILASLSITFNEKFNVTVYCRLSGEKC